ncbi:hypothetical protein [Couchioplanes caeruleus]|nr:hypothetical protein [Couchioplanes caeruleus]ROP29832.1 hypothetical protein EDD30_2652 [Couchioplanes caeruleus]
MGDSTERSAGPVTGRARPALLVAIAVLALACAAVFTVGAPVGTASDPVNVLVVAGGDRTGRGSDDRLRPGWIHRLPADASGPDVQLAQDNGGGGNPGGTAAAPGNSGTVVTFPLPAALAVLGSILLALVTAAIVARRRTARWFALVGRGFRALGEPVRRRRLVAARQSLGLRFAADADSVRRAYDTIGEVAATADHAERPVYAVRVDRAGTTVWLSASDHLIAPWQSLDRTRWRRASTAAAGWGGRSTADQAHRVRAEQAAACLVRAGADADGEPVFVDLSRLDGVLSVTGDQAVTRDVVRNLLSEIAQVRPNLPVTLFEVAGGVPLPIPSGLAPVPRVPVPVPAGGHHANGPVRGAAARRPVRGLVVVTGTPDEREAAELMVLCGPGGAGWTGLVCGPVGGGAHWRWHTGGDGNVDIPVLGMTLTVPA